jgi:glycerol-3-phosphate dehydrogenase (NAD(P)+)
LENVIAIVVGLDLGFNPQAALINRGLMEVARLGRKFGADPLTFLGLSGMGDLVVTCTGSLNCNRRLGEMLGLGKDRAQAERELGGVAGGVSTVKAVRALGEKLEVELPIIEQVYKIVH